MTVQELLSRISSKELTEWLEYFQIEPFGFEAEMLGHAITSSVIVNTNRKKGSKAVSPADFMPRIETQPSTIEDTINFVSTLNAMYGGKDMRENGDT